MSIDPGWYPDPVTPGQLRYWGGTAWTDQVEASAPPAPVDELPPPPDDARPAFGAPAAPTAPPVPEPTPWASPDPLPGGFGAATPSPPSAAPGTWGAAPLPSAAQPAAGVAASPSLSVPMQRYSSVAPISMRRDGATGKAAWVAALLGLQASIPLLTGLAAISVGATYSRFEDEFGDGLSSDVSSRSYLFGVLWLTFTALMLWGAVGTATAKASGRIVAVVVEVVAIATMIYSSVKSESAGPMLLALVPLVCIGLILTDR
jgi:hypothetical protein